MPNDIKTVVAVIQNDIANLKITMGEIKDILVEHITKHQEDRDNYQKQNETKYAGKWVETQLAKVIGLVVFAFISALITLIISNPMAK